MAGSGPASQHLSSGPDEPHAEPVDKSLENPVDKPGDRRVVSLVESPADSPVEAPGSPALTPIHLGFVVPKRLARRAVTRNLLRRQMRAAVQGQMLQGPPLAGGSWVVRLRAPFDKARFPSAASDALRRAAREELSRLLRKAAARP